MKPRVVSAVICFGLSPLGVSLVVCQVGAPPTNLERLEGVCRKVAMELLPLLEVANCDTVLVRGSGDTPENLFFHRTLVEILLEAGYFPLHSWPAGDVVRVEEASVVEFDVEKLAVGYGRLPGVGKADSPLLWREVSVGVRGVVSQRCSAVGRALVLPQHFILEEGLADTILASEVQQLEAAGLPFAQGERPPPQFGRYLREPFFFIGVTGVIVYLLYAVRSG